MMAIAAMLGFRRYHDAPRSDGFKVHQRARSVTRLGGIRALPQHPTRPSGSLGPLLAGCIETELVSGTAAAGIETELVSGTAAAGTAAAAGHAPPR